jgi:hypothetical protein
MTLTDYDLAVQGQNQYNGLILTKNVSGITYSIVQNDDALDIIFQGTTYLKDAQRDIEALMVTAPFGRVHGGAFDGLYDVYQAEKDNIPRDRPVRLSLHSLGAMRACLFTCILYHEGYRNLECVTMECPLWGNADAVTYFNQTKNRTYQNYLNLFEHDIFTTIPLHLPEEPYVPPPNKIVYWSAPTMNNEWHGAGVLIESHSLSDCVIPGVKRICQQT